MPQNKPSNPSAVRQWADRVRRTINDGRNLANLLRDLSRTVPAGGIASESADVLFQLAKELGVADASSESVYDGALRLGGQLSKSTDEMRNESAGVLTRLANALTAAVQAGGEPDGVSLIRTDDLPREAFRYLPRGVRLAEDGWGMSEPSGYFACVNVLQVPVGHVARSVMPINRLAEGDNGAKLLVLGWARRGERLAPLPFYLATEAVALTTTYRQRQESVEAEALAAVGREEAQRAYACPGSLETQIVERLMALEAKVNR